MGENGTKSPKIQNFHSSQDFTANKFVVIKSVSLGTKSVKKLLNLLINLMQIENITHTHTPQRAFKT